MRLDGFETIRVEVDEGLTTVSLCRPHVRNALDYTMVRELHRLLDRLDAEESHGVLVITGAGRAFSSGWEGSRARELERANAVDRTGGDLFDRLEEFGWPTIAAIEGVALGAGCELAVAADLRVAGESSRLGLPEVVLGSTLSIGAAHRLTRLVGLSRAKELVLTGEVIGAREAGQWGLVNRLVPDGRALEEAETLGWRILKQDPLAVRTSKALLNACFREGRSSSVERLARAALFDAELERHRQRLVPGSRKKADSTDGQP